MFDFYLRFCFRPILLLFLKTMMQMFLKVFFQSERILDKNLSLCGTKPHRKKTQLLAVYLQIKVLGRRKKINYT